MNVASFSSSPCKNSQLTGLKKLNQTESFEMLSSWGLCLTFLSLRLLFAISHRLWCGDKSFNCSLWWKFGFRSWEANFMLTRSPKTGDYRDGRQHERSWTLLDCNNRWLNQNAQQKTKKLISTRTWRWFAAFFSWNSPINNFWFQLRFARLRQFFFVIKKIANPEKTLLTGWSQLPNSICRRNWHNSVTKPTSS